jgi:hypothetical protein
MTIKKIFLILNKQQNFICFLIMNLNQITIGNSKEHYNELIKTIQELAIQLSQNNKTLNRRSLVSYLNSKIENLNLKEGSFIKNLLRDTYEESQYSEAVRKAIVSRFKENLGNDNIFNPERVQVNCNSLDFTDNYLIEFQKKIHLIEKNTGLLENLDSVNIINNALSETNDIKEEDVISITGGSKVESAYDYANNIRLGYKKLIDEYELIKNVNLNIISDFEFLRNELRLLREDLIQILIDLFGNKIKQTNPDLFNFEKVEWYDFEDTWSKIDLYFSILNKDLETFHHIHDSQMNQILSSGSQRGKDIFKKAKKSGVIDKADVRRQVIGFAIDGAIGVFKSRGESKKTVAKIYRDIEKLKLEMQNDSNKILSDILRLGSLYSKLKDDLIPSFKLFISTVNKIVIKDIKPIYNEIISSGKIGELRSENASLLTEKRMIELELIDKKLAFPFIQKEKEKYNLNLESHKYEYNYLKSIRPEEPGSIYSAISFGKATKLYNEVEIEWKENCFPMIVLYDSWRVSLRNEDVLKNETEKDINLLKNRKSEIELLLKDNSNNIFNQFSTNEYSKEILKELLTHIKVISDSSKTVLSVQLDKNEIKQAK